MIMENADRNKCKTRKCEKIKNEIFSKIQKIYFEICFNMKMLLKLSLLRSVIQVFVGRLFSDFSWQPQRICGLQP